MLHLNPLFFHTSLHSLITVNLLIKPISSPLTLLPTLNKRHTILHPTAADLPFQPIEQLIVSVSPREADH